MNIIDISIAALFFLAVMAITFLIRAKPSGLADEPDPVSANKKAASILTGVGHYAYAAANLSIGVLLGLAINGVVQLIFTGAWVAVFNIAILVAVLWLIVRLHARLGDLFFPSGIRLARNPKRPDKPPMVRRFSLPAGLILGVALADFGLDGWILETSGRWLG